MRTAIAIMAGGGSIRMGRDKALLDFDGEPMLQRLSRRASHAGRSVAVIGREIPEGWGLEGIRFIPDDYPGQGPLGGLATALRHIGTPTLALACDLPLLTTEAMLWLLDLSESRSLAHGLITIDGGMPQPLFSVYTPSVLPLAETLLAEERRSLRALQEAGVFTTIELPPEIAGLLRNVNTPEEYGEVRGVAMKKP